LESWWRISHLTWFIFVKPYYNVQKQLKCNVIQRELSATCFCSFPWRWYRQSTSKWCYAKSQCQSPFPLSLESCHLLKVDFIRSKLKSR
jgi:hypothetical protein